MDILFLLAAIAAFNLATTLSFANLYLKSGASVFLFTIALAFVATNIALAAIGLITGIIIVAMLPQLAANAGAALIVVLGVKRLLKGWKIGVEKRFYDITIPKTRFALLMAVNMDTLMLGLAAAMLFDGQTTMTFSLITSTAIGGTLIGIIALKNQQLILSNLIEIISGAIILITGIIALIF